jgi:alpha-1,6-mannosyltransferase
MDLPGRQLAKSSGSDVVGAPAIRRRGSGERPCLVDTTMLFGPHSGGVRRYLLAKQAWMERRRPHVRHALLVPGDRNRFRDSGLSTLHSALVPFSNGYRLPTNKAAWRDRLIALRPAVIEAGDPYMPGHAALDAGAAVGAPVIGYCHGDTPALASLYVGHWADRPVRKRWGEFYRRCDATLAASRYIAERLSDAGAPDVIVAPLGVDTALFHPRKRNARIRKSLGLSEEHRLLVFAGRPSREKRLDVLVEAVERLDERYVLILVGAGPAAPASERTLSVPYQDDPRDLGALLASCDAFVHANDREPFGLIVLEAMACGLPVVGVRAGGVSEIVDDAVGQLAVRANAASFASAIETLFDRDVRAVGESARRRVEQRHSWEIAFEGLTDIYANLSGEPAFSAGGPAHAGPRPISHAQ